VGASAGRGAAATMARHSASVAGISKTPVSSFLKAPEVTNRVLSASKA